MGQQVAKTNAQLVKEQEIIKRRATVNANVIAGFSFRRIAKELGVSVATVHGDYKAFLKDLTKQYIQETRHTLSLQNHRLNMLLAADWEKATNPTAEGHGAAADRALRVLQTINRINGLDTLTVELPQTGERGARTRYVEIEVHEPDENADTVDAEFTELPALSPGAADVTAPNDQA